MEKVLQIFELLYYIFAIIGLLSFIWAFYTFIIYRKQLHSVTLSRCIDIYRDVFLDQDFSLRDDKYIQYVDFVNEELFYMQNKFIPKSVAKEWLDGMINYMPLFYLGINKNPSQPAQVIINSGMLNKYKRVIKTFSVSTNYDFELIFKKEFDEDVAYERNKLINEIYRNIKTMNNLSIQ